jgi:hypothetical protein
LKEQGNRSSPKTPNFPIIEFKDTEMPEKEFKSIHLKMINDLKDDSNNLMNEGN